MHNAFEHVLLKTKAIDMQKVVKAGGTPKLTLTTKTVHSLLKGLYVTYLSLHVLLTLYFLVVLKKI